MTDSINPLKERLLTLRQTVRYLLEQAATVGGEVQLDPQDRHRLDDTRRTIAACKVELRVRGIVVDDEPEDTTPTIVKTDLAIDQASAYLDVDRRIYHSIRDLLAWDGIIYFLNNHPFGASFERSQIDPLYDFLRYCNDPAFEFIDANLESIKVELHSSIRKFVQVIGKYMWSSRSNPNLLSTARIVDLREPQEQEAIFEEMAESAQVVVQKYEALVKSARRKLYV